MLRSALCSSFDYLKHMNRIISKILRAAEAEPNFVQKEEESRIERMIRELHSDLADLVSSGEMTAQEANEWVNHKTDQWAKGLS